jgi:hypothetical protein
MWNVMYVLEREANKYVNVILDAFGMQDWIDVRFNGLLQILLLVLHVTIPIYKQQRMSVDVLLLQRISKH